MNLGTEYGQQCYESKASFPFGWVKDKWSEGFYVTSMATSGGEWRVVMSKGTGFSDQVFFRRVKVSTSLLSAG